VPVARGRARQRQLTKRSFMGCAAVDHAGTERRYPLRRIMGKRGYALVSALLAVRDRLRGPRQLR
jgi:hypothetical protein